MNFSAKALSITLLLALLTASCSTSGYFIPPRSTETQPPALAFLFETQDPPQEPTQTPPDQAEPVQAEPNPEQPTLAPTDPPLATDTPPAPPVNTTPILYYVQAADTLPTVAVRFGVQPSEISSPDPLPETAFLNPGQLLIIPRRLANTTSPQHVIPDSEVVYSPSATDFDIDDFVSKTSGKLNTYNEWLKTPGLLSGAQVVQRVAIENSINPRLLLALLEYNGHWVYGQPGDLKEDNYPMGLVDLSQRGLYHQLVWAVNQLSIGYYAYREGRLTEIHFSDGVTARLAPDLNAGSAALQYFFAQLYSGQQWLDALDMDHGFPALEAQMFGNPWERAQAVEPLFPAGLAQPAMTLPFARNWLWSYTGGPHGAWEHDGAYAALDFAPGSTESGCVKSIAWAVAAASGLVVRSGVGVVVLDLDGDGHEQTGWVLLYLHISTEQRVPVGNWVDAGDPLGHPSCEGGVSTGTHLHIARKYNGEWIPADGPLPFNLGGWVAHYSGAAYKGTLTRDGKTVIACTCSSFETNITRGEDDP